VADRILDSGPPLIVAILVLLPQAAQAQACLYPRPTCQTWLISEFGVLNAFENELQSGPVNAAYWELGLMKRLNARSAIGLSAYATYDDSDFRRTIGGVKARARRWLTRAVTLDVGAGLLLVTSGNRDPGLPRLKLPGFTSRVDVGLGDWIGVLGGVDVYGLEIPATIIEPGISRLKDERHTWYGGIRLGKYPGVIAGIAVAVLLPIVHRIQD
jgi:hypothetical protein